MLLHKAFVCLQQLNVAEISKAIHELAKRSLIDDHYDKHLGAAPPVVEKGGEYEILTKANGVFFWTLSPKQKST